MNSTNIYKPILYSTEMVQALLAERKKQTRRVITNEMTIAVLDYAFQNGKSIDEFIERNSKYQKGDILWVRETIYQEGELGLEYVADKEVISEDIIPPNFNVRVDENGIYKFCNIPSIYMPKEICRIFHKVTNVRCERLQDISDNDAIAEGLKFKSSQASDSDSDVIDFFKDYSYKNEDFSIANRSYFKYQNKSAPIYSFKTLWDSINAKKYPWESNPWVWVYDFERIEKPEDFL